MMGELNSKLNEKKRGPKMRQSWDEYFLELAQVASTRATCNRLHVGCILVRDKRIIATGYNGAISAHDHCDEVGHLMIEGHCKRTIHAEVNAVLQCAKYGIATEGATAYITHYPCQDCMKLLNQAGIKRVVYLTYYPNEHSPHFTEGMIVEQFEDHEKIPM
jgi:dCMP deaminase